MTLAEIPAALLQGLQALSGWEFAAVGLAVAYLLLAIGQSRWCWPAAIASAAIYLFLMFDARLYMQSVLQLFYIAMAIYGWICWRAGEAGQELPVISWSARDHVRPLLIILFSGAIMGGLMAQYTHAAAPWLDALAASGAVVTTWMVARKILQNWAYWFVIDLGLAWLYASQGLWLTALLFLAYLVMIIVGYRSWRASMTAHV